MKKRGLEFQNKHRGREAGFSLLELMVCLAILLVVTGTIMGAMLQLMKSQAQVSNRTEMHANVRSATELLEQEVSQAGRISLPANATLSSAATLGATSMVISSSSGSTGMFAGEQLTVDSGANQETVTISSIAGSTINVSAFLNSHAAGVAVQPLGSFSSGIIPPAITNGSTGSVLKLFGDINGDGSMVYVEYTCDTAGGNLYRNSMPFSTAAGSKPTRQVLLSNIQPNPNSVACFTYQTPLNNTNYVIDVAITLTVQTARPDANTGMYDPATLETKALLNVAPRNVVEAWNFAGLGLTNRVQATPASVTALTQ